MFIATSNSSTLETYKISYMHKKLIHNYVQKFVY